MAAALEEVAPPSSTRAVGGWVASLAQSVLEQRARKVAEIESASAEPSSPAAVVEPARTRRLKPRRRGRVAAALAGAALAAAAVVGVLLWPRAPASGPSASASALPASAPAPSVAPRPPDGGAAAAVPTPPAASKRARAATSRPTRAAARRATPARSPAKVQDYGF